MQADNGPNGKTAAGVSRTRGGGRRKGHAEEWV